MISRYPPKNNLGSKIGMISLNPVRRIHIPLELVTHVVSCSYLSPWLLNNSVVPIYIRTSQNMSAYFIVNLCLFHLFLVVNYTNCVIMSACSSIGG